MRRPRLGGVSRAMTWVDEGAWGRTGDADTDFPEGSVHGDLFNPKCARHERLSGNDAAIVDKACRAADGWLHSSQFSVGLGEYVISLLRNERTSRALTEVEVKTLRSSGRGCDALRQGWQGLGEQLQAAIGICQAEGDVPSSGTEDCRQLWARVVLARGRGESQIGAGVDFSDPNSPQPGCVAIQAVLNNLQRGGK